MSSQPDKSGADQQAHSVGFKLYLPLTTLDNDNGGYAPRSHLILITKLLAYLVLVGGGCSQPELIACIVTPILAYSSVLRPGGLCW